MTVELLTFALGLLLGGILMFIYLWRQGKGLKELLADKMITNKLLKDQITSNGRPNKSWNNKSKKRYYNGKKKKTTSTKS